MMTQQKIEHDEKYWNRWHELIDIRAERELTEGETGEYNTYLAVARQLDGRETERCSLYLNALIVRHNEFLFSLDRLTERIENSAGEQR